MKIWELLSTIRVTIKEITDDTKVKLMDGRLLGMIEQYQLKSDSLDPIKGEALRYSIINQYLYLWRSKTLKCIYVDGIWENILDWQDIQSQEECNDIYDIESGIGQSEVTGIMQIMATLLQLPLSRKDDDSDDRNSEIR